MDIRELYRSAQLASEQGPFAAAEAKWREILALAPDQPIGLCGLGNLYLQHRCLAEAEGMFREAVSRFPDYVWAAHGYAAVPSWQRNWTEAEHRWRDVSQRFSDHTLAAVELARALYELGRETEAKQVLDPVLGSHKENVNVAALAQGIDQACYEASTEAFIHTSFRHLLQRDPTPNEVTSWIEQFSTGTPERRLLRDLMQTHEYGKRPRVVPGHIIGNFYSPIVDPDEVAPFWKRSSETTLDELYGIEIDLEGMRGIWLKNRDFLKTMNLTIAPTRGRRFPLGNTQFPNGDALTLAAMINHYRPKRIIEVGSGYSTAVMLDTLDQIGSQCKLTCIDPNASRLRSNLHPSDMPRVTIIEDMVQNIDTGFFSALSANDILFLDTTHVLKTGSDVHYELFSILPLIAPGVIIHIHDCQFPFEYPEAWVLKHRWSWNEAYAVRAFLMYNMNFKIVFFNDLFCRRFPELTEGIIEGDHWPMHPIVGHSIWITRV